MDVDDVLCKKCVDLLVAVVENNKEQIKTGHQCRTDIQITLKKSNFKIKNEFIIDFYVYKKE